jgi:hypothetical protein
MAPSCRWHAHAHYRTDLLALPGDARVAQRPSTPTIAHPFSGGLGLPIGISDVDVAPKVIVRRFLRHLHPMERHALRWISAVRARDAVRESSSNCDYILWQ